MCEGRHRQKRSWPGSWNSVLFESSNAWSTHCAGRMRGFVGSPSRADEAAINQARPRSFILSNTKLMLHQNNARAVYGEGVARRRAGNAGPHPAFEGEEALRCVGRRKLVAGAV